MDANNSSKNNEPRIGRTLRDDIHQVKIKDNLSSEYNDLKEYFLTDERKDKIKTMGRIKKFFIIPWWLLKSLFFKLTPFVSFSLQSERVIDIGSKSIIFFRAAL